MTTVRIEVETKLAAFAASKGLPVAYEEKAFTKPAVGNWLGINFLGDASKTRNLDAGGHTEFGMFQVTVFGRSGLGLGAISTLAREVAGLFPVIPKMPLTSIEAPANIGGSLNVGDGFVCVPVTLRYRAEF